METTVISGFLLILLAGGCSGTFALPFKHNSQWKWENNWFIWSIIALLVAPWIMAFISIPDLESVYAHESNTVLLVAFFGLLWVIGAILFGKGIDYLGVSLSLPIMQGLINVVGTLMPVILRNPSELLTPTGLKLLTGTVIILAGIIFFAIAGHNRDSKSRQTHSETPIKKNFRKGLIICLLAGIFGPMINFAFVYGAPLQEKAVATGASSLYAANVIWSIALSAGFIINLLECIRLFGKNQSWKTYRHRTTGGLIMASLAGVLWYLSIMFYGMGGSFMGVLGASVGWATMQSTAIIAGNVAGLASGEWKGATRYAIRMMVIGLVCLIGGVVVIAL